MLPFSKFIFFNFKIQLSKEESFHGFLKKKKHDKHTLDIQYFKSKTLTSDLSLQQCLILK